MSVFITFLVKAIVIKAASSEFLYKTESSRNMLLTNLAKFYDKSGPITFQISSNGLGLPTPVLIKISSYLDPNSLNSFSKCSKEASTIEIDTINARLWEFSPYFHFAEDWFNEVMHKLINENFPYNVKLEDDETPDYLSLMTLKYVLNEYSLKNIPKYVYLAILSFFHEIVFEPNSHVPTNEDEWKYFFGQTIQQYNLPLTSEYYYNYLRNIQPSQLPTNTEDLITIFEFLSQKPNIDEQISFFSNENYANLYSPSKILVSNSEMSPEEELDFINELSLYGPMSSKILDCFEKPQVLEAFFEQNLFNTESNTWLIPDLYRLFGFGASDSRLAYILTRNHANRFSLDEFLSLGGPNEIIKYFEEVLRARMPFLIKFDIIASIIRSNVLNLSKYSPSLREMLDRCFKVKSSPIYELILMESPSHVHFSNLYRFIMNPDYLQEYEYERIMLALRTQFSRENPIALLYFLGPSIYKYGHYILNNYNMNVRYLIDFNPTTHLFHSFPSIQLEEMAGQVVSFKQILKFLYMFSLIDEAFESNLKDNLFINNSPIYSLSRFLDDSILEEVSLTDSIK